MDLNVRSCGRFSLYSAEVPDFLHNRPKGLVTYVIGNLRQPDDRSAKRVTQISNGCLQVDGKTSVKFGDDSTYPFCTCSEWRHNRLSCKHFCLIFANIPGWGWEKLSSLYRESPLLNLDYAVMGMGVNEKQPEGDASWSDTSITDITADDDLQSSEDAGVTLPLPSRGKGKSKSCRYTAGQC